MPPARSKRPAPAAAAAPPAKRVCTDEPDLVHCQATVLAAAAPSGWALTGFGAVLAAASTVARALEYVGPALRADRGFVLAAVAQNGWALQDASKELRADRPVVITAVARTGGALMHASEELRADRGVVLVAVDQDGWALQHASPALRADRGVVLAAVAQAGWALKWACPTLQADPDVVLVAMTRALEWDEPLQDVADVLCSLKRKHGPFAGAVRATKMQRCRLDQHTDAPERCPGTDIPILIE